MGNNVTIDEIAKLTQDGSTMVELAAVFRQQYNTIYDTVDQLMETWKGQSSEKYLNDVNSFKDDLDVLITTLDGYGQLYEGVGKAYEELEETM